MTTPSVLPFTMLMPMSEGDPIEILDPPGRRFCLVDKGSVHLLDDSWNRIGVYVLFDLVQADGAFGAYVGKAPAGLRNRLLQHEREKQFSRALLVDLSSQMRFTSAHAGWLEGELHAMLQSVHEPQLHNRQVPRDDTIPSYDVATLGDLKEPVRRIMGLLGHRLSTLAESEEMPLEDVAETPVESAAPYAPRRPRASSVVTLGDLIAAGLIARGEALGASNRDRRTKQVTAFAARVSEHGGVVLDGQEFATPSGAAERALRRPTNGWDFWGVDRGGRRVTLAQLRSQLGSDE